MLVSEMARRLGGYDRNAEAATGPRPRNFLRGLSRGVALVSGIRPLVYGGFIAVLVPLLLVVLGATVTFGSIGKAFDRTAESDAVVTAANTIDRGTLVLRRLVDLYNSSGNGAARDAVTAAEAELATSIGALKSALGGR